MTTRRRHLEGARALPPAALDGDDVERAAGVVAARGDHGEQRDHGDRRDARERRPVRFTRRDRLDDRADGEADLQHDPREQDHATDPGDADERSADLADAHAGERHAAEREREAHRLDERVGGRSSEHAPPAGRRDQRRDAVEAGEDQAGGDVPGDRQLPHPAGAHPEPGEAEEHAVPPPRGLAGRRAEGDLEQRDADERQRPEAPRRHRQRDEEAAAQREGRPRPLRATAGARAGGRRTSRQRGHDQARSVMRRPGPGARRCARGPIPAGGRRTAWRWRRASGR